MWFIIFVIQRIFPIHLIQYRTSWVTKQPVTARQKKNEK